MVTYGLPESPHDRSRHPEVALAKKRKTVSSQCASKAGRLRVFLGSPRAEAILRSVHPVFAESPGDSPGSPGASLGFHMKLEVSHSRNSMRTDNLR